MEEKKIAAPIAPVLRELSIGESRTYPLCRYNSVYNTARRLSDESSMNFRVSKSRKSATCVATRTS